jgi:signal transduction histidine kinase
MNTPMRSGEPGREAMPSDADLFERLADPYLVVDDALTVIAANAAWRASFGESAFDDASPGDRAQQLGQCDQLIRALVKNLRPGQRRHSPAVLLNDDAAEPRYWQIHASFLSASSETEPARIVLRFDDVTARTLASEDERRKTARLRSHARLRQILAKEAQDKLDENLRRFEQALAFAGVGAWEIDIASGDISCSERCLRHLAVYRSADVTRERLLGERPESVAANWQALENRQPFEVELDVLTPEGRRWVLVRGMASYGPDGAMQSVMGFTLDITSRKEHELELSAVAGAERSGRERSEALARTMDQFIAAVSHELRSPLNAIVSWAELLQLVASPSHVARAGEAIRRNGRQLSLMVDDLLDSGAVVTGKLSVKLQPVDLGALVAIVVEDMRRAAEHKGLQLRADDIAPCVVMADESRMKQVVWNLLTNAVKFTDAGDIDVTLREHDACAELRVSDTGRGIEPEALPLVFDRFQQIAPKSSGRVGGLGLGLWLVKQIVGLHAGTIAVTSEGRGHGAVFTIRIPLEAVQPD